MSVYERDGGSWRYRTIQDLDARLEFALSGAAMSLGESYEGATIAGLKSQRGA